MLAYPKESNVVSIAEYHLKVVLKYGDMSMAKALERWRSCPEITDYIIKNYDRLREEGRHLREDTAKIPESK